MCPLYSDKGEMDLDHTQRSQNLRDATDNVKTGIDGGNYQNYIGLQERKWKISLYNKVTGIRQHNKHLFGVHRLHVSTC